MSKQRIFRCAIYTRKSHEEGLDQDFNSLDAQYESCQAYIVSQASLGWKLRDKHYDDGGISGGHLDRPGLIELIADIKAGLIDIVVVYKVDRLTRSLTDFSKLVDVFDDQDVSFVSVTQAFNTTTSMGRLTLNVLLSFAQFEREVTAERIRDKIAASKKKGMWMGGTVPFGYRNQDRQIFIRDDEATTIRKLFVLYLQYKNVRRVKREADRLELNTRIRMNKSGKITGGKSFYRGHIYAILNNPLYIGRIQHKDNIYKGNHEAIVDQETWDRVQSTLKSHAVERSRIGNSKSPALLAGLLLDDNGQKLVPHHANKKGQHYHYYVSQKLKSGDQDIGWRVPAKTIEDVVHDVLVQTLKTDVSVIQMLNMQDAPAHQILAFINKAKALAATIGKCDQSKLKALYNTLFQSIVLNEERVCIRFKELAIQKNFNLKPGSDILYESTHPLSIKRRGQEMKMVIGGKAPSISNVDSALIKLVAKAYALKTGLEDGSITSIKEFAQLHKMDHGDAKNLMPLAYLAPNIVTDILNGHQPVGLTAMQLKRSANLPVLWIDQRKYFEFE